jgi:hypothetical protein
MVFSPFNIYIVPHNFLNFCLDFQPTNQDKKSVIYATSGKIILTSISWKFAYMVVKVTYYLFHTAQFQAVCICFCKKRIKMPKPYQIKPGLVFVIQTNIMELDISAMRGEPNGTYSLGQYAAGAGLRSG